MAKAFPRRGQIVQYRMALTYRKPHLKSRVFGAYKLLACTCSVAFKGSLDYRSPAHPGAVPVKKQAPIKSLAAVCHLELVACAFALIAPLSP